LNPSPNHYQLQPEPLSPARSRDSKLRLRLCPWSRMGHHILAPFSPFELMAMLNSGSLNVFRSRSSVSYCFWHAAHEHRKMLELYSSSSRCLACFPWLRRTLEGRIIARSSSDTDEKVSRTCSEIRGNTNRTPESCVTTDAYGKTNPKLCSSLVS
jgi:hypothetical protein